MTLKQRRLKKELKKNPASLFQAAVKAGYSPRSRTIYQNRTTTHRILDEVLGEDDKIKNDFEMAKELALKNNDLTNYNRSNENLARIKGMFLDKTEITNKNPDKIVIAYSQKVGNSDEKSISDEKTNVSVGDS